VSEKQIDAAAYYHARAADMMAKAQAASSKAVRAAYLNLAEVWGRKAVALEKEWLQSQLADRPNAGISHPAEQKTEPRAPGTGNF